MKISQKYKKITFWKIKHDYKTVKELENMCSQPKMRW